MFLAQQQTGSRKQGDVDGGEMGMSVGVQRQQIRGLTPLPVRRVWNQAWVWRVSGVDLQQRETNDAVPWHEESFGERFSANVEEVRVCGVWLPGLDELVGQSDRRLVWCYLQM